jgi:2-amino-4-hydroxy-6-hydroxymethyldihydropteridine diphosphokinase
MKQDGRSQASDLRKWAFVALGSNLGDAIQNVLRAMERLKELSTATILESSLWQTEPVDCPPGSPLFVNAVAGLLPRSDESPEILLTKLQALEREFGRKRKILLNEPRPLDLDLIAFGNETRTGKAFILPHPRAHERRFVLQPLAEIAPELVLLGQSKTVKELLTSLPPDPGMKKLEP